MGKLLRKVHDVVLFGAVRLGGTKFQQAGSLDDEEWKRMDTPEASEIQQLFSRLSAEEQALCLSVLLRSRYPQLFGPTSAAQPVVEDEDHVVQTCGPFMLLKSAPNQRRRFRAKSTITCMAKTPETSILITNSFDIGAEMQLKRHSAHAELPKQAVASCFTHPLSSLPEHEEEENACETILDTMAVDGCESIWDSMADIMQTAADGLVLQASEPLPPGRLEHDALLTQILSTMGNDAPVEAIEQLLWKMERISAGSCTAWASAISLLSSSRQRTRPPAHHRPLQGRLLDTFDHPLPISTRA